jgi:hypothetical protein
VTAPVILSALLFWAAVFTVYFAMQGMTPLEFLLGRYEPLPPGLGTWSELGVDATTGWLKEERLLLPGGAASARYLLHQSRYRNPATGAIEEVEPERRIPRRRVSAR